MEIRAEIETGRQGNRIYVESPPSAKEQCQEVSGMRWCKESRRWHCPVSWASCKQLRGVFGANLEIGPKLLKWAQEEVKERIAPSLAIRESLMLEPNGVFDPRLYAFQRAGSQFLFTAKNALLSDPMGAGKTVQVIAAAKARTLLPALVICPSSMRRTWGREVQKWWPGTPAHVVEGTAAQRKKILDAASDNPGFVIINWEAVRLHSRLSGYGDIALTQEEKTPKILNQIPFKLVVADEAHRLKDPRSKQTRAVWSCGQNPTAHYRWALTGTPLTNAPDTLWPVLHFLDPNEWPGKTSFIERYCTPPDAPVYMADGSFKPIGEIQIGDEVIGFSTEHGSGRCLESARVLAVNKRIAPEILKVTLESGQVVYCTPDHKWLSGRSTTNARKHDRGRVFIKPTVGKKFVKVVDVPEELPTNLLQIAGWLGGIHDGEGTGYCIASQSFSHNPDVCQRIDEAFEALSIGVRKQFCRDGSGLPGQLHESGEIKWHARTRNDFIRFLNICNPVRRHEPSMKRAVFSCHWRNSDEIVSIESIGEGEVVSLTTSTETYVVYGYASHNCLKSYNLWGGLDVFGIRPDREQEFFQIFDPRFRRMHKDVVLPNLPPLLAPETRECEMGVKQKKAYKQMVDRMFAETEDGSLTVASSPMVQTMRMLQFASCYVESIETTTDREGKLHNKAILSEPSCKLDSFMDDLPDMLQDNESVVVFANSSQLIKLLTVRLEKAKIAYGVIQGGQSPDSRQNHIDDFQNGKVKVILVVTAAGGTGITLTAARTAVFLQLPWSNVDYQQAVGRVHRIGSEKHSSVRIIHYLTNETIEETMMNTLDEKAQMLEEICRDRETLRKYLEGK